MCECVLLWGVVSECCEWDLRASLFLQVTSKIGVHNMTLGDVMPRCIKQLSNAVETQCNAGIAEVAKVASLHMVKKTQLMTT